MRSKSSLQSAVSYSGVRAFVMAGGRAPEVHEGRLGEVEELRGRSAGAKDDLAQVDAGRSWTIPVPSSASALNSAHHHQDTVLVAETGACACPMPDGEACQSYVLMVTHGPSPYASMSITADVSGLFAA
ncbi:hypothetical protein [Streptomyces sp. NPDC001876]|uniref:hypothetical protein n=1 Tax=Streptomyces sp. NPDC001876 TaxID=3154402 RepID=UPI003319AA3F